MVHNFENLNVHIFIRVFLKLFENEILIEADRHSELIRWMERKDKEAVEQLDLLFTNIRIQEEEQINLFIQVGNAFTCETESIREQIWTMEIVQSA